MMGYELRDALEPLVKVIRYGIDEWVKVKNGEKDDREEALSLKRAGF